VVTSMKPAPKDDPDDAMDDSAMDRLLHEAARAPALAPPEDSIGQTLGAAGRYVIERRLGRGGMGTVYAATDTVLRRQVALKVLPDSLAADPKRKRRLLREARAAAAVTHSNVASVYDVGETDGHVFIAMELVSGETLRGRMTRGLGHEEALRLATQVARGLARAHEGGVVHRDLKPENIMVTPEGDVKILDFGLAKLVVADPAATTEGTALPMTVEGT